MTFVLTTQQKIKARLVELTDERVEMVNQALALTPGSTKRTIVPTYIRHPSLLVQLRDTSPRSTAGGSGGASSKPCVNLVPIDTLALITEEASAWLIYYFRKPSRTVEVDLRFIYGQVDHMHGEDLHQLDVESKSWVARARVASAWDSPPLRPYVTCIACDVRGGLRLNAHPLALVCTECGATWEGEEVDEFGLEVTLLAQAAQTVGTDADEPADAPNPPEVVKGLQIDGLVS